MLLHVIQFCVFIAEKCVHEKDKTMLFEYIASFFKKTTLSKP